jgi:putative addiction module killer protein
MYYVQRGTTLIIMLAGGDKTTQSRDIELAKQRAKKLDEAT